MKSIIAIYLLMTILSSTITVILKSSILGKTNIVSSNNVEIMNTSEQSIFESMWSNLFSVPRTRTCSKDKLSARIKMELNEEGLLPGQKVKKSKLELI